LRTKLFFLFFFFFFIHNVFTKVNRSLVVLLSSVDDDEDVSEKESGWRVISLYVCSISLRSPVSLFSEI